METATNARLTKKHYACYAIMNAGRPLTRVETMTLTHAFQVMDGCEVAPFSPTSNVSYWLPRAYHQDSASRSSFRVQGLMKVVGKRRNAYLYDLTPEGRRLAEMAKARLGAAGALDWRPAETVPEDMYAA
jgi:hypothetical protein